MPTIDDYKKMLSQTQAQVMGDPDNPLNQIHSGKVKMDGVPYSKEEFADMQSALIQAAKEAPNLSRMKNDPNIPDSVKQDALNRQRMYVAMMKNNQAHVNNGMKQKGQGQQRPLNAQERGILNLARREGIAIPQSGIDYTSGHQKVPTQPGNPFLQGIAVPPEDAPIFTTMTKEPPKPKNNQDPFAPPEDSEVAAVVL